MADYTPWTDSQCILNTFQIHVADVASPETTIIKDYHAASYVVVDEADATTIVGAYDDISTLLTSFSACSTNPALTSTDGIQLQTLDLSNAFKSKSSTEIAAMIPSALDGTALSSSETDTVNNTFSALTIGDDETSRRRDEHLRLRNLGYI